MLEPDKIIRSARKTLSICVDAYGRLIVRAPRRMGQERIFAFLREKQAWIEAQQAKRKGAGVCLPSENLDGYTFPLLGTPTQIRLVEGNKVGYDAQENWLRLPKENPIPRLQKWLKDNAKRIFTAITQAWAERMGVNYTSVGVSSAKTRWGSCSGKNVLRYTYRLLYCPREIVEYVAVHELAHIRYKNHSKAFWQEVERYLPDWKQRRKWLKARGWYMEIF